MPAGIGGPHSSAAPGPGPDHLPQDGSRRRRGGRCSPRPPQPAPADSSTPAPDRREDSAKVGVADGAAQQNWPGLPRGVQFNPSDADLIWHLAAEVGNGLALRHPFISEFIKSVDDERGFSCTHPEDIPGVRQDGHASYFFHKSFDLNSNKDDKNISWQKIGTPESIIYDGNLQGCKEVFILCAYKTSDSSPQKTDWILHQFHIRNTVKDEEELVLSKIFYESQNSQHALAGKISAEFEHGVFTSDNSKEVQGGHHSDEKSTEDNGNNQEQMQAKACADQNELSSPKDILYTSNSDTRIQLSSYDGEDEHDHMSLKERYRILLADKNAFLATLSSGTGDTIPKRNHESAVYGEDISSMMQAPVSYDGEDELDHMSLLERYRLLHADKNVFPATLTSGTGGTIPKRNHESAAYGEDINRMLQEISSAPPIVESMDDDSNRGLISKDLSGASPLAGPCLYTVGKCNDPLKDSEMKLNTISELPITQPSQGSENNHLVVRKDGAFLVDVKLEPAMEGYEIDPSESPLAKSHKNVGLDNKQHADGSVPSLGVKSELSESQLTGLCEASSINTSEHIAYTTNTPILDNDGDIAAFCSHQQRKRKTRSREEYAEGVTYCSRRRRTKKTATDSIEKALDEDAPGLLQILLNRGITVDEIKLYGAEEDDDEMLPDCTESNFADLENVITKLFPQRTSLLKLSVARHERGTRVYCLPCLISLIEQSRYLQFRGTPVEWGWCRDLQSFIFVFRSHNRIVLERPEYGYATYFFEVVQSLPMAWQIRRLVTAMKLNVCTRTALIENRPLLVGEDLTEGEARVLEEYGWSRNCGLASMLNYRDRVVHDKWSDKYITDWRAKIGKLLMAGYAGGETVITQVPKKAMDILENLGDTEIGIKVEDPL